MRILVVGSGGREHAICWALKKGASGSPRQIYCAPGNAGIAQVAQCVSIGATDVKELADFAERERVELTIAGSEAPLAEGLVDEFERRGLSAAGPPRGAARLESSKAFAKDFMARHNVPTARYRVAHSAAAALEVLRSGAFGGEDSGVVVKADGLAAGKGVVVARTRAEAEAAVIDMMEGRRVGVDAARRVVLEEVMTGREASLLLWTDGRDYRLMPAARDHKRVGEGDTGPNTGGMGAITAPGVLSDETLAVTVREIVEPTLAGADADGLKFRGVLFIGLMLTDEGPRVLEYNVRLGDPEAQAIFVRLETDLADIFGAVARGGLGRVDVRWSSSASACVVLAARGYPEKPETGAVIGGLDAATTGLPNVRVFHAGTKAAGGDQYITSGGRVLGVTATDPSLDSALRSCYEAAGRIHWDGIHYRRDIGRFA